MSAMVIWLLWTEKEWEMGNVAGDSVRVRAGVRG